MPELKPCFRCGGAAKISQSNAYNIEGRLVKCTKCQLSGRIYRTRAPLREYLETGIIREVTIEEAEQQAITWWNDREELQTHGCS